ncbi:hypothetical protein LC613_04915 [Nostoc sphaeroides CHAB 2801]|uniref:Uncharacterized protein n=1 Tax=Nostoc sphaeroides CCNUC1 TaxID=2653204 RepID=A0A5P8W9S4_9NOSO|nr:hypothetical protein [Nostoc sphaeroides]MCC5627526.1 hypothetical protein [Nostoc sphaeroides CHAB 2801]QFS49430.1 hypothetical protein GXM_06924 [Nostoc sphaeroides CCNUC1]
MAKVISHWSFVIKYSPPAPCPHHFWARSLVQRGVNKQTIQNQRNAYSVLILNFECVNFEFRLAIASLVSSIYQTQHLRLVFNFTQGRIYTIYI